MIRPRCGAALPALGAALLLLLGSACSTIPEAPPPSGEGLPIAVPDALHEWQTVRGLAQVRLAGPAGTGSTRQAVLVALPDRGRLESLTPLGTTAAVLVLAGEEIRLHSVLEREFRSGRASREAMERLTGVAVPPGPWLRLLAGLPPLPVREADPRTESRSGGGVRTIASVDGSFWQRLQLPEQAGGGPAGGVLGDASGPLLEFGWEEWRPVAGWSFPHSVRARATGSGAEVALRYEWVRLGEPLEAELFRLSPPAEAGLRSLRLEEGGSSGR